MNFVGTNIARGTGIGDAANRLCLFQLVPEAPDGRRIAHAERLDGGRGLQSWIGLKQFDNPPKLAAIVKTAASGPAAACVVGRHELVPSIAIQFTEP